MNQMIHCWFYRFIADYNLFLLCQSDMYMYYNKTGVMKSQHSELTSLRWKNGHSDLLGVAHQPSHPCDAPGRTLTRHLYDKYHKWKIKFKYLIPFNLQQN